MTQLAPTTKPQRAAIKKLWDRDGRKESYRQFRRRVQQGYDCLMIQLWGMWIGIEPDGYTHS